MANTLGDAELHRLARLGAIARLKEIEAEAAAIRRAFPGLGQPSPSGAGEPRTARRKRQVSPEAREAARKRMQEYWAKRKAAALDPTPGNGAGEASETPHAAHAPRRARRPRVKKAR